MKDVLKISILLILALSNGALFAQTNRYLNLNRDTLDIKLVKDTLVTSTIQDTLATIPAVKDSMTAKQDEINDSALYYRLILHYRDSVNHNLKRICNKDAFKFKDDSFREKMREPWIGDVLRDIFLKLYFLSLCIMLAVSFAAKAQSKLIFKDKFMYTDVQVFNETKKHSIPSLIDTGCSLCVIDSIFAIDSCGIKEDELQTIPVNQTKDKISSAFIDSMFFCGKTYHKVYCLVADLTGLYQKYAPKFIVGANILRSGAWKFDMEKNIVEPYDYNNKTKGIIYKWKNHEDYPDVAIDYIILDSKVNGKKTRFAFDTGCRNNKLQRGLYVGKLEQIQKETANIVNELSIKTAELCRDVTFKIGKDEYTLDFIIGDGNIGLLNIEFLQGHSFILNYKKQTLELL